MPQARGVISSRTTALLICLVLRWPAIGRWAGVPRSDCFFKVIVTLIHFQLAPLQTIADYSTDEMGGWLIYIYMGHLMLVNKL